MDLTIDPLLQGAVAAAAIAVLNAYREIVDNKNFKPLLYTLGAGAVAALLVWLFAMDSSVQDLGRQFVLGLGGSGIYTLTSRDRSRE